MRKALLIAVLALLSGAALAQDGGQESESSNDSFGGLDLSGSDEEESGQDPAAEDEKETESQEGEAPLLDLSGDDEVSPGDQEEATPADAEKKTEPKPEELTNILVVFKLTSDESAAEVIDLVNAEAHMVLDGSGKYQLLSSDDLAEGRETHPDTALGYCDEDPECIANIVADKKARWAIFGNLKKSFDGTLILARLVMLDIPKRKVEVEKFGQFKRVDANLVPECGNLVRQMIGLEVVKPKPKPKPVVAKVEKPPELAPKPELKAKPPETPSPWSNPWTWTLTGVGLASVAGGIVLGMMSNNKVDDAGHPGFNQPDAYGIIQDAEDLALGANIAFGVGGAALAGAVVLFIIDATSSPPSAAPAVACSGSGCSAVIFGNF